MPILMLRGSCEPASWRCWVWVCSAWEQFATAVRADLRQSQKVRRATLFRSIQQALKRHQTTLFVAFSVRLSGSDDAELDVVKHARADPRGHATEARAGERIIDCTYFCSYPKLTGRSAGEIFLAFGYAALNDQDAAIFASVFWQSGVDALIGHDFSAVAYRIPPLYASNCW
jgi:hypothetical protein